MSSLASLPEMVGFFSYSREDDEAFKGTLSALREGIQRELSAQLGRSKRTFRLWQDQEAIAPGKLWESEIKAAVAQAVFFIPIVTPRTVGSKYCQFEFEAFLARERALGRTDLIFPIVYITIPGLDDESRWRGHNVLSVIGERQYVDWRHLRHLSGDSTVVREAVERFCQKIVDSLNEPWQSPEERQAQEEQERQEARERQCEQLALDAETRAADEKQRKQAEDARRAAAVEAEHNAAAVEATRKAEAESKAVKAEAAQESAEAEARQRAEADDRQEAEQKGVAVAAVPAAGAKNAPPVAASRPDRSELPQTSKQMIWALGGILAAALLIEPLLFHLADPPDSSVFFYIGLIVGAFNCMIAAGLVLLSLRRDVLGLCMFGLLVNGFWTISLIFVRDPKVYSVSVHVGPPSLFYFIVCLVTLMAVWRARPSLPLANQGAPPAND